MTATVALRRVVRALRGPDAWSDPHWLTARAILTRARAGMGGESWN